MRRILAPIFWVAALGGGAGACGGSAAGRPSAAVDAYARALQAGDYAKAYELMSARYRREHPREEFIRLMKESPAEVRETSARLRAGGRQIEVTARLRYGEMGDELVLVEEGGEWRIASDPLAFYAQDTPARALRSFLRAVELKRWDVVLRFVPDEYRRRMTAAHVREEFEGENKEQNENILRQLKAQLDNPIDIQGDVARMPFGDRYEVKFKRERGLWKIEDLY